MAKVAMAFADNQGKLHPAAEQAVLADLMMILGRIGAESGITAGLAKCIMDKRAEIEAAFADWDAMNPALPAPMALNLIAGGGDA